MVAALFAATKRPMPAPVTASASTVRSARVADAASRPMPIAVTAMPRPVGHPRADAVADRATERRDDRKRHRQCTQFQTRLHRPEMAFLHQVERHGDETAEKDHVGQQRRDEARIEGRDADQCGIDHRAWSATLAGNGADHEHGGHDEKGRLGPDGRPCLSSERQRCEERRRDRGEQQRPGRIDAALRIEVRASREQKPPERQADQPNWDVHQEDQPPAPETGQDPAERRPDAEAHSLRGSLDTETRAEPRRRQHVSDQRVGVRLQHHGAGGLDEPREYQQPEGRRERAGSRTDDEDAESVRVQKLPADSIGNLANRGDAAGEDEHVDENDPFDTCDGCV